MIRRPPRSTRTDTLLPYPTLFRSPVGLEISGRDISFEQPRMRGDVRSPHAPETVTRLVPHRLDLVVEQANEPIGAGGAETDGFEIRGCNGGGSREIVSNGLQQIMRSDERRVGTEWTLK